MPTESFQVVTYRYYNWSSRSRGKTNLILQGPDEERCSVWFEEDDTADLTPATYHGPHRYSFFFHHSQLDHLIDMLRNEKPIFVYFDDNNEYNNSRISTSHEPVGEGEQTAP